MAPTNQTAAAECALVDSYLSGPPAPPPALKVKALLQHIAECEECLRALREREQHLLALLETMDTALEVPAAEAADTIRDRIVEDLQREYVLFARAALERVDPTLRDELSTKLDEADDIEALSRVSLRDLPAAVARLALAQVEASTTLSTLIGAGDGYLLASGELRIRGQTIPTEYFASVLEPATRVHDVQIWRALVGCALAGGIGMPGLAAKDCTKEGVVLEVASDGSDARTYDIR